MPPPKVLPLQSFVAPTSKVDNSVSVEYILGSDDPSENQFDDPYHDNNVSDGIDNDVDGDYYDHNVDDGDDVVDDYGFDDASDVNKEVQNVVFCPNVSSTS
ncbi:hypothetical protein M5689_011589 [Euphorbia peplus]|nr:hypothetical protein M5689_011589 [Euphorbia peplus]